MCAFLSLRYIIIIIGDNDNNIVVVLNLKLLCFSPTIIAVGFGLPLKSIIKYCITAYIPLYRGGEKCA